MGETAHARGLGSEQRKEGDKGVGPVQVLSAAHRERVEWDLVGHGSGWRPAPGIPEGKSCRE